MLLIKTGRPLLLLALLISLWPDTAARAGGIATFDLTQLVQKADVIAVGTVGEIRVGEQAEFGAGVYGTPGGAPLGTPAHEVMLQARNATALFTVEQFLKGGAPSTHLYVTFPTQFTPAPGINTWFPLTELTQGERIIVFLTQQPTGTDPNTQADPNVLALFAPFSLAGPNPDTSAPGPKIAIGTALMPKLPGDATPLRRTLLVLAAALSQGGKPNKSVVLSCLQRIEGIGYLLELPTDTSGANFWLTDFKKERTALGEPPTADLENFVTASILPAVMRLTTNADSYVRGQAIVTAAALQDIAVIPRLAEIAQGRTPKTGVASSLAAPILPVGDALERLGDYRTPASVRPLTLLLKHSSPRVREKAATALLHIGDRRSIPSLLDDLDDPDPDARFEVVRAMYTATQTETGMPGPEPYQQKPDWYHDLWSQWAADHAAEVEALRQHGFTDDPKTP